MEQQQRLEMVEFGVAGLADIRTLLSRWKQVLAYPTREAGPSLVMKTYRVLERFLADLKEQGLEVCEEPLIPGVVMTCRLKPRNLQ
jgi:hypothetical protein